MIDMVTTIATVMVALIILAVAVAALAGFLVLIAVWMDIRYDEKHGKREQP